MRLHPHEGVRPNDQGRELEYRQALAAVARAGRDGAAGRGGCGALAGSREPALRPGVSGPVRGRRVLEGPPL